MSDFQYLKNFSFAQTWKLNKSLFVFFLLLFLYLGKKYILLVQQKGKILY